MSDLFSRFANLSPERRKLFLKALQEQGLISKKEEEHQTPPIVPVPRDRMLPLSFAQQRLWFLDQLEPDSATYNIPTVLRLKGQLDVAALERSLDAVVQRHETLRTTFAVRDGQPFQVIASVLSVGLPVVDLEAVSEAEREAEVQRLAVREARRPFDLQAGPLMRVTLLRLSAQEHVLVLNMHHIVSDEWSTGVLTREVTALYEAFAGRKPARLPELPVQYADYATWQRERLRGEMLKVELGYWKAQLEGVPTVLDLPTDRPRPPHQTYRGDTLGLSLSQDLTDALKSLGQVEECTLFMTLLAAFGVMLHRYTGQEDILVGAPIANRNRAEIEGLIGFFANTLVLRTRMEGNPSFLDVLRQVRETTLDAYVHQDVPFEMLVDTLQPQRDLSRSPLFQVMLVVQNAPMEPLEMPGLTFSPLEASSGAAKFDLTLSMVETEQGLMGGLEYSTDLFDTTTIERMVGHLETLLESIVAHPAQRISELQLLTKAEQLQLVIEWNDTQMTYSQYKCVHDLFEAQTERTPDAVAVVFPLAASGYREGQHMTYRELNRRANQLGYYLQALGVGPETLVGVYTERSMEMVVALLGVLKAGGAYVPLDPEQPPERLAFMLQDAHVQILLTQTPLANKLSNQPTISPTIICLDTGWPTIVQGPDHNLGNDTLPENLAYVIYTSGSTGVPKGTLVPHRGLVNYLTWCRHAYSLDGGQGAPLHSPISFDLTVTSLFAPLVTGRSVWLLPESLGVEALSTALREGQDHSLVKLTPAHLELLSQQLSPGEAAGRTRAFIIGGENLLAESLTFWQTYAPETLLVNEYGPTETVVGCCVYRVPLGERRAGSVPIGRPITNTQVYLLDRHLSLVPVGVACEMYIGGDGVARGYYGRPELTAERFIPNPFSNEGGAHLYKTGDQARYLPDGNIEFLGRADQQVKVRGFRIELGEVEAALVQHEEVREAVALVREDEPGNKRLVAYAVARDRQRPTTSEMHSFLRGKLPGYMVPSTFVILDEMPLMSNGKVDRRALPAPEGDRPELEAVYVAPRNVNELQLVPIWEDILDVYPVGVRDSFFDLGGHSLLAIRLFSRIQDLFGRDLPVSTLFQGATIEHLAIALRQQQGFTSQSPLVGIQPMGTNRPFFCVHPVGGGVLQYVALARQLGQDQPFYGLQAPGTDDGQEPFDRIEDMASHYVEAIRAVQPSGPYLLGGWSMGGIVAFTMAQLLQSQGQGVALLALLDVGVPCAVEGSAREDDIFLINVLAHELGLSESRLTFSLDHFLQLDLDEQVSYCLEQTRRANVLPPDFGLAQIRRLFRVTRANIRAMRTYIPRGYPGHIALFAARERFNKATQDPTMGWGELVAGGVDVRVIPGDHYAMLREPHVQVLAEQLRICLDEAQAAEQSSLSSMKA
jgi:amino acid adenylation domain-containing protein